MTEPTSAAQPVPVHGVDRFARVRQTFDDAAPLYDGPSLAFFRVIAADVVRTLRIEPTARVLDIPCGTGHVSAAVLDVLRPSGHLTAIDLSPAMIDVAAQRLAERVPVATLRIGDLRSVNAPDESFDVVLCVFGLFFVADIPAAIVELWRLVAPGGRLALVTWAPGDLEPVKRVFMGRIHELRPDLAPVAPSDHVVPTATRAGMTKLLDAADISVTPQFQDFTHAQPIDGPASWWDLVMGAGLRGLVDAMTPSEADDVQKLCAQMIVDDHVTSVGCDSLVTILTRP